MSRRFSKTRLQASHLTSSLSLRHVYPDLSDFYHVVTVSKNNKCQAAIFPSEKECWPLDIFARTSLKMEADGTCHKFDSPLTRMNHRVPGCM